MVVDPGVHMEVDLSVMEEVDRRMEAVEIQENRWVVVAFPADRLREVASFPVALLEAQVLSGEVAPAADRQMYFRCPAAGYREDWP